MVVGPAVGPATPVLSPPIQTAGQAGRARQSSRPTPVRAEVFTALRARLGALAQPRSVALGLAPLSIAPAIDQLLPWRGLPTGALHEVGGGSSALGFVALLLARAAGPGGRVLWCETALATGEAGTLYGAGLHSFGLAPEQLLIARTRRVTDMLWAMEEGLRSGQVAAVVGETAAIGLTAGRRLQLAAETGGALALLLDRVPSAARAPEKPAAATAALTRWRVAAAPMVARQENEAVLRWQITLDYCRGGPARSWLTQWRRDGAGVPHDGEIFSSCDDETNRLVVVAELGDRPAPARAIA
ncbi:MAG: hypothetical protein EXQ85_01045 [Alphaproteobacteria bacterium]|nr:hypothetical protein [Alphaproteobacteria bacterium]